jgi:hypothetical protein
MVGLTILASILIYPAGVTPYIDALFFAAGAATQSGLNTLVVPVPRVILSLTSYSIDTNKLHTYQQVNTFVLAFAVILLNSMCRLCYTLSHVLLTQSLSTHVSSLSDSTGLSSASITLSKKPEINAAPGQGHEQSVNLERTRI